MRKITLLMLTLALLLISIPPLTAQEDGDEPLPTIAEYLAASASEDLPQFASFFLAVSSADPDLLVTLSNADTEYTVFLPTDEAFAAFFESLEAEEMADAAILGMTDELTSILEYHLVEGLIFSENFEAIFNVLPNGLSIPSVNGQAIALKQAEDGQTTISGAGLVETNIEVANGIIHVIDTVLVPEARTVAEVLTALAEADEPEFTTLLSTVNAAEPFVLESLSNPELAFTIFAPTDAAFEMIDNLDALLEDEIALTDVLIYHIIDGRFYYFDLLNSASQISGEETASLPLMMTNEEEAEVVFNMDLTGTIAGANLIRYDIDAANGVIHVIDAVISPGG